VLLISCAARWLSFEEAAVSILLPVFDNGPTRSGRLQGNEWIRPKRSTTCSIDVFDMPSSVAP